MLTPISLSLWEVIFIMKRALNIFLHGSMHILRDTENASLAFKIIVEKNNKHMKKIKHSESPIERRQLLPKAMATLLSACKKEQ
jgi:hypothetical protein